MKKHLGVAAFWIAFVAVATPLAAQSTVRTPPQNSTSIVSWSSNRASLLVLDNDVSLMQGGWNQGDALRDYAHRHAGRYIVFLTEDGALHRIDSAAQIAELEQMYAPMRALGEEQRVLGEQQKALGAQQRALGAEMRAAGSPGAMSQLGNEQGKIGRIQGQIGRQQGEIGRQQGEHGKAIAERIGTLMDACLQQGTCQALPTDGKS